MRPKINKGYQPLKKDFYRQFLAPASKESTREGNNTKKDTQGKGTGRSNQGRKFNYANLTLEGTPSKRSQNKNTKGSGQDPTQNTEQRNKELQDYQANQSNSPENLEELKQNLCNDSKGEIIDLNESPIDKDINKNTIKTDESNKPKQIVIENTSDRLKFQGQGNVNNSSSLCNFRFGNEDDDYFNKKSKNYSRGIPMEEESIDLSNSKNYYNKKRSRKRNFEESKSDIGNPKRENSHRFEDPIVLEASQFYSPAEVKDAQENLDKYEKYEVPVYSIVEVDSLTPMPKKRDENLVSDDVDYNQAKSAAIFIRRIEYSYNLKLTRLYKRHLKEIIFIQRYWRYYVIQREKRRLRLQIILEEKRKRKKEAFRNFLNTVTRIYYEKRIKEYFYILYHIYIVGKTGDDAANMIIHAWRKHKKRVKDKRFNMVRMKLFLDYMRLFMTRMERAKEDMEKLIFLQRYIKFYLWMNSEDFYLEIGREYHPFLYYLAKYRNRGGKDISKLKTTKITKFISYANRWKAFHQNIKDERIRRFVKIIQRIFYMEFFNIFMANMADKISHEITVCLLAPRIDSLLFKYFRGALAPRLKFWRRETRKGKGFIISGKHLINQAIRFLVFRPMIKRIKRKIYNKNKVYALFDAFDRIQFHLQNYAFRQIKDDYIDNKNREDILKTALLKNLLNKKELYLKFHYYYLFKEKTLRLQPINSEYNSNQISEVYFVLSLAKVIKNSTNEYTLNEIKNYGNKNHASFLLGDILEHQDEKINKIKGSIFCKWQAISKISAVDKAAKIIGQCYKKKIVKKSNKGKTLVSNVIKIQTKFRQFMAKKKYFDMLKSTNA
ncbi:MAG: hypothetical protein MJ252_09635 [archaeon]|nr:hypothetical protein [archaeon]